MQPRGGVLHSLVPSFPGSPAALARPQFMLRKRELARDRVDGVKGRYWVVSTLDATPAYLGETAIIYGG